MGNISLWNPESWVLESGIQFKKFGILLKITIPNPSITEKNRNPVPGTRNRSVESRIQDCLRSLTSKTCKVRCNIPAKRVEKKLLRILKFKLGLLQVA